MHRSLLLAVTAIVLFMSPLGIVIPEPAKFGEDYADPGGVVGKGDTKSGKKPEIPRGPKWIFEDYYDVQGDRIKFIYKVVRLNRGSDWRTLSREAKKLLNRSADCHIWDDKWYWTRLSETENDVLLLVWWNIDKKKHGWVAVKNRPKWFMVTSNNSSSWISPENGGGKKYYRWSINGESLDIDIRNPDNEDGWTGEDIWYSFGFPN